MSSAGASSSILHAEWFTYAGGYYRLFEPDHPEFTVAFFYSVHDLIGDFWFFEACNCSDDFRPDVIFDDGPLVGDVMLSGEVIHRSVGPQADQHSYPLDITVLTDTEDLPF